MVKVGDIVAYPKRAAYTVELEEDDVLVASEIDLFGIVKRGEE
jgi:co-chaperonin GroES (HSP10)